MRKTIAIVVILILVPVLSWATTYYVRADGEVTAANKANATSSDSASTSLNMTQFNAALFEAGDTVYFSAVGGDYTSQMTIPSEGAAGSYITIEGLPDGAGESYPLIDVSHDVANAKGIYIYDKSYVLISNLQVKGSGGNGAVMIYGNSGAEGYAVIVSNVSVLSNFGSSDATNLHDGFSLGDSAQAEFLDCVASGTREASAPYAASHQSLTTHSNSKARWYRGSMSDTNFFAVPVGVSTIDIYDATMNDAKLIGFSSTETATLSVYDSVVTTVTGKLADSTAVGATTNLTRCDIDIDSGGSMLLYGTLELVDSNIIVNASETRFIPYGVGSIIRAVGNTIHLIDCSAALFNGIGDGYVGAFELLRNIVIIDSTDSFALVSSGMAPSIIDYNVFNEFNSTQVILVGSGITAEHRIANNVFYRSTSGLIGIKSVGAVGVGGSSAVVNNIFYNVADSINGEASVTTISNNDYFQSSNDGGAGSITGDPLFWSPSTGDFNLHAGSPCINTGADLGLTADRGGRSVPVGVAPDMGAFEYTVYSF